MNTGEKGERGDSVSGVVMCRVEGRKWSVHTNEEKGKEWCQREGVKEGGRMPLGDVGTREWVGGGGSLVNQSGTRPSPLAAGLVN